MPHATPWVEDPRESLTQRHDRLRRTSYAMWTLLKSRLDLTDEKLAQELERLDSMPPSFTFAVQLIECEVCRRPMRSTARCCLYCGTSAHAELKIVSLTRTALSRAADPIATAMSKT